MAVVWSCRWPRGSGALHAADTCRIQYGQTVAREGDFVSFEEQERTGAEPQRGSRQRSGASSTALGDPRRLGLIAIAVIVAVLFVGGLFFALSALRASSASAGRGASGSASAARHGASAPTAVFAHVSTHGVAIHFPARPGDMLDVGFHQAYNPKAYAFQPTMKMLPIAKPAVTADLLAADSSVRLFEEALRGRGSSARSAADCAVRPGSKLVSPVTGKVTLLKHYKLE